MAASLASVSSMAFTLSSPPVTASPMTVLGWFQTADTGTDQTLVFTGDSTINTRYWWLEYVASSGGELQLTKRGAGGASTLTSVTTAWISANTWFFFGFSDDGTTRRIYVETQVGAILPNRNLQEFTDSSTEPDPTVNTFAVGRFDGSSPSTYLNGKIGHVAQWNVRLTTNQIIAFANGANPLSILPGNLQLYLPFSEDTAANCKDIVGATSVTAVNSPSMDLSQPPIFNPLPSN
jgi:hypothetical protein